MEVLKFKTNIKCDGCIAKITPALNRIRQVQRWAVDLKDSDKILTVEGEHIETGEIVHSLSEAGYYAEKIA